MEPGVFGALTLVLVVSLSLNLSSQAFPLAYHPDETRKVEFVLGGHQDFKHPILILQIARAANALWPSTDPQRVAEIGRTTSAIFGTLVVLLSFVLFRRSTSDEIALFGAFVVALSPVLVVHAHYFKEDMALTTFLLASLLAFFRVGRERGRRGVLLLGFATGLAASSHYKSVALVLVFALGVALHPSVGRRQVAGGVARSLVVALVVFAAVNHPALSSPGDLFEGLAFEARHVVEGHHVRVDGLHPFLSFHLVESLLPGLTTPILTWTLAGVAFALWRLSRSTWEDRVLLVFLASFYLAVELAPLKPYPGFIRYVIPVVPALLYFGCSLLDEVWRRAPGFEPRVAVFLVAGGALLLEGQASLLLVDQMGEDTRVASDEWVTEHAEAAVFELYASGRAPDVATLADQDFSELREEGVSHVVSSSFLFERLALASRLEGQKSYVYDLDERYDEIFRDYVYREFRPPYRSFAFSGPTIRVVDIRFPAPGDQGS